VYDEVLRTWSVLFVVLLPVYLRAAAEWGTKEGGTWRSGAAEGRRRRGGPACRQVGGGGPVGKLPKNRTGAPEKVPPPPLLEVVFGPGVQSSNGGITPTIYISKLRIFTVLKLTL
jgi:hypothetical protein